MTIWNNAGRVLRRTFAYSGRAGRIGFWWWAKLLFGVQLVLFVLQLVPYVIFERILPSLGEALLRFLFAGVLVWFFGFLPTLSLTVRRLHDTGRSGLCIMGWFVIPGFVWLIFLGIAAATLGTGLVGGDPPVMPFYLSLGVALLLTAAVVVWAIWWLAQEGDIGPNRFRGCRTMTGRFRQNGVGEGVRHATYGG